MVHFLRYPLRIDIHCWGGLGSQLYALNLAFRLTKEFPKRHLRIVFHSGGVTRRPLELDAKSIPFPYSTIDDYVGLPNAMKDSDWNSKINKLIKNILNKSGLLAQVNTDLEYARLSRWVVQIRGHYSFLDVSPKNLTQIGKIIGTIPIETVSRGICRIHLRLGDLLTISEKQPVNPNFLIEVLLQIRTKAPGIKFEFYSDSNRSEVEDYISEFIDVSDCYFVSSVTQEVIKQCSRAEFFVGTNSKISNWICAFRSQLGLHSFVPDSNKNQIPTQLLSNQITFYPRGNHNS